MSKLALIVIDLQKYFLDPSGIYKDNYIEPEHIVQNLTKAIIWARNNNVHVYWIKSKISSDEFYEPIKPLIDEEDTIITKDVAVSAFDNTELDNLLLEKDINNILICGIQTDICILATYKDAKRLGYTCNVISDCCGAKKQRYHNSILKLLDKCSTDVLMNYVV